MQQSMMLHNAEYSAIDNTNGFEKTECDCKKLKNIAPNVPQVCLVPDLELQTLKI